MLAKHSSNTVTVRSVVIMVVGLQVWGYGRHNREAQRKATHNEGAANSILKVSVQQMYMYVRGHNQIEAFPTKYSYEALTSNLPLLKLVFKLALC